MEDLLNIIQGDALTELRELPAESVHCCVTSPPYWGLRDYGTAAWEGGEAGCDHRVEASQDKKRRDAGRAQVGSFHGSSIVSELDAPQFAKDCGKCGAKRIDSQLGLEKTPEEYVAKMVEIFREVRRVLRRDVTLWLNMGDSIQDKQLQGIPWRLAFALQADGWWLRSDIIWAKPNPMPESVTDRPTKAHEYLFLLTKSANYFYDAEAIKEPHQEDTLAREDNFSRSKIPRDCHDNNVKQFSRVYLNPTGRNKRSVWTVATAPYPEAHFATYPPDLIKPCIMAGTSAKGCCAKCGAPWERVVERGELHGRTENDGKGYVLPKSIAATGTNTKARAGSGWTPNFGYDYKTLGWQPTCACDAAVVPCTVLDPFAGSGTTGAVALELGRRAVLIELNPQYVQLIEQRCNITLGLALA